MLRVGTALGNRFVRHPTPSGGYALKTIEGGLNRYPAKMASQELLDRAAEAVLDNVSLLARRLRQRPVTGALTQAESAALGRLTTSAATVADLARAEDVRPQSMGAVVTSLEERGLVKRQRDRNDGRRVRLAVTRA